MDVQVVQHQMDRRRFWVCHCQGDRNLSKLKARAIRCSEGEMAARSVLQHRKHWQSRGAMIVILPRFSSWNRWRCRPQVSMQGDRLLIYADHRFLRVIRPLVHPPRRPPSWRYRHHPGRPPPTFFSRYGFRSWLNRRIRMVSLPTRGTNLRLTVFLATRRTVQRARPWEDYCIPLQSNVAGLGRALPLHLASAFIQCPLQATLLVTTANITYGLRSEWDQFGNLGAGLANCSRANARRTT